MAEAALILAALSALLLVASVVIWAKMLEGPLLQRLDGRRTSNANAAGLALQVLVFAFGLSAIAAILAVGGWLF